MAMRVADVLVICARCRSSITTLPLTVSGEADPLPIYGVCDTCRTEIRAAAPYGRSGRKAAKDDADAPGSAG